jgi:hypothetical protein
MAHCLRSASIEANNFMIIPIMSTVNNWLAILTLNPENVINARLADHAGVIERWLAHCERQRLRIRRTSAAVVTSRPGR